MSVFTYISLLTLFTKLFWHSLSGNTVKNCLGSWLLLQLWENLWKNTCQYLFLSVFLWQLSRPRQDVQSNLLHSLLTKPEISSGPAGIWNMHGENLNWMFVILHGVIVYLILNLFKTSLWAVHPLMQFFSQIFWIELMRLPKWSLHLWLFFFFFLANLIVKQTSLYCFSVIDSAPNTFERISLVILYKLGTRIYGQHWDLQC